MRKRNISIIAIIVVIVAALILLPKSGGKPGPGGNEGMGGQEQSTVFTVRSELAQKGSLQSYIEMNGDVEADTKVEVYPDIGGKLARLYVNLGSNVKKGDKIAEVDPSKPGQGYALSPVFATISGTVTSAPLRVGATISTTDPIAVVSVIDELQVNAKVPERYVSLLKLGLRAKVTLEAYSGVDFYARISRISPVVDSVSRTKQIYLVFEKTDSRINAGMFAKVKMDTVKYDDVLTVPEDSILTNFDEQYVFVIKDDMTVEKRVIKKGATVDGVCEVVEGLSVGEKIVIQGMRVLSDGSKVRDITDNKNVNSGALENTNQGETK